MRDLVYLPGGERRGCEMVAQFGLSGGERGRVVAPSIAEDPSESAFTRGGDWFVLHTRTHQERALSQTLSGRGIACFLPLQKAVRFQGRRKVSVQTPLFANYLFLRGSLEDAYTADRTGRVANILRCPDQAQIGWELENLRRALAGEADFQPHSYLREGVRVEVRTGPFRGVQGWVEHRPKGGRLILRIETLGRAVSFEVDASLLDVVD